jgi:hypothetical protein
MTTDTSAWIMGWREWASLPELHIECIKAKIDTGARTSVLHAFQINLFERDSVKMVDFLIHPDQRSKKKVVQCKSYLHDLRWVADSGGHKELRPVIKTTIQLGQFSWPLEITLTNRDDMRFRFLLARIGIPKNFLINVGRSYLLGKKIEK